MRKLLFALPLLLVACTSAPARQNDADQAGRSTVTQTANSWQNDFRELIQRQPDGSTISVTINNYGDGRTSDQSQSNQGSTTQEGAGASATQTPTATGPETPVNITVPAK